jgi:hypothetical protein
MENLSLVVYPNIEKPLIIASGDKKIAIWDIQAPTRDKSISPIHRLDAKAFEAPNVVAIDPRSALLATASTELVDASKLD